jgi:dTDP-4-dehydrorhamnose 3,5-epimerase
LEKTDRDPIGRELLVPKQSAVNARGELRAEPIYGVRIRLTKPVPHEDGHLIEIARADWDVLDQPITQFHLTTTLPGRVRAWGLHARTSDRLFVACGLVRIVCFDGREESPTYRRINEVTLSDRSPGLITIPPKIYHGWKNIGVAESIVINMPTCIYDYDKPDSLDLPWDSDAAKSLIPYTW